MKMLVSFLLLFVVEAAQSAENTTLNDLASQVYAVSVKFDDGEIARLLPIKQHHQHRLGAPAINFDEANVKEAIASLDFSVRSELDSAKVFTELTDGKRHATLVTKYGRVGNVSWDQTGKILELSFEEDKPLDSKGVLSYLGLFAVILLVALAIWKVNETPSQKFRDFSGQ